MEANIPVEIKNFKEKIFLLVTLRQLISILVGAVIVYSTWYLCKYFRLEEYQDKLIMISAVIPGMFGYYENNGMNFETFLIKFMQGKLNSKLFYIRRANGKQ